MLVMAMSIQHSGTPTAQRQHVYRKRHILKTTPVHLLYSGSSQAQIEHFSGLNAKEEKQQCTLVP